MKIEVFFFLSLLKFNNEKTTGANHFQTHAFCPIVCAMIAGSGGLHVLEEIGHLGFVFSKGKECPTLFEWKKLHDDIISRAGINIMNETATSLDLTNARPVLIIPEQRNVTAVH